MRLDGIQAAWHPRVGGTLATLLSILIVSLFLGGDFVRPERVVAFSVEPDLSAVIVDLGNRSVQIPLDFTDEPTQQTARSGPFTVEYYPPSLYREIDSPLPGTILLVSEIPHELKVQPPAGGPGEIVKPVQPWPTTFPQSVEGLYASFDALNDPDGKPLCDERRSGTWTYLHMEASECFVWCTGYSNMTVQMLRASGAPARIVTLNGFASTLPSGVLVQTSESHTTIERWNGDGWAWVDPTFRVREATLGGRTLSVYELIVALASGEDVRFTRWHDGAWVTDPYSAQDPKFRAALRRYFSGDKELLVSS